MGKTYKHHCKTTSFKNYLTRIPGSLNSKKCANNNNGNLQKEDPQQEQVTLVKEWNGIRPSVKGKLLRELYTDLVDKYVKTGKEKYTKQSNKHSRRIIVVIITTESNEYKQLVERTHSWIEWT
jgi:hypothetical protein